jgi:uncharacterized SAM-dependent methyltransferase
MLAHVAVHPSQFPEKVRRDLLTSLRAGRIDHKFHYETLKQARKWIALYETYSPSRTDADCAAAYSAAFESVAAEMSDSPMQVVSLCCGDGSKDARLFQALSKRQNRLAYMPCDASLPMVLTASRAVRRIRPADSCTPLVCDVQQAPDLRAALDQLCPPPALRRLVTLFGTFHNYEPGLIAVRLKGILSPGDTLLLSVNLAPEGDYSRSVRSILPQYDNALTYDWLCAVLLDMGISARDGRPFAAIENSPSNKELKRIALYFRFSRHCSVGIGGREFSFRAKQTIRLFFSYRYTPELLTGLLRRHGLEINDQWISRSGQEGVFLCRPIAIERVAPDAMSQVGYRIGRSRVECADKG